jgi:cyclopropane-fatty-acyl-phospholipid synthase
LEDFTQTPGLFDRIASIEMIESLPSRRWPEYFRTLRARLAPGGLVGLQAISISDRWWSHYDARPDFIQEYVFPGGQLPTPAIMRGLARDNGLLWRDDHHFGASYARTLALWKERFEAAWTQIAELGFDDEFRRLWRYYLSYCEGGFRSGRIDVGQIILARGTTWP